MAARARGNAMRWRDAAPGDVAARAAAMSGTVAKLGPGSLQNWADDVRAALTEAHQASEGSAGKMPPSKWSAASARSPTMRCPRMCGRRSVHGRAGGLGWSARCLYRPGASAFRALPGSWSSFGRSWGGW